MKTLFISAAVAAATLAGAASATVPDATKAEIQRIAPEADLSTLSNAELVAISNALHSGDSASDERDTVRSLIRVYQ